VKVRRSSRGSTFSDGAQGVTPKVFDDSLRQPSSPPAKVGGILDTILNRPRRSLHREGGQACAAQIKERAVLSRRAILVVAIGVIAVMLIKVIPEPSSHMYKGGWAHADLPRGRRSFRDQRPPTGFPETAGTCGSVGFAGRLIFGSCRPCGATDRGKEVFDRMMLRLPIIGGDAAQRSWVRALSTRTPRATAARLGPWPILDRARYLRPHRRQTRVVQKRPS